jgi:hypothetical protein
MIPEPIIPVADLLPEPPEWAWWVIVGLLSFTATSSYLIAVTIPTDVAITRS